jgi:hypothetical protein
MQQGLTTADAAALESVGASQQQQQQRGLDVAYQDYQNQIQYPQTQINNMSTTLRGLPPTAVPTTGTTSGYTTTFAPSPLSGIAAAYGTYKGLTTAQAKGGLIQGYAAGGAVEGDNDLYSSVMADYGQYLGGTSHYDNTMAQVAPRIAQNTNAMTDMAAYHASHAPIASPNTVPALYKQYNTLKSSLNPGAVDEASAAANAMQAKYNEGLNALNPNAVTSAADAANAKLKELTDPAAISAAFNSGAYNVGIPQSFGDRNQRIAEINRLVAAGYTTTGGPDSSVWYMKPKTIGAVAGMPPPSKQAEYDKLLNNYNTLNTGYNTGVTALAPQKAEYDALMAKYNTLNDAYTAGSAKLAPQKAAYEKALKASEVPSPWGNAMPHLAHGGRVPGYAQEGYVDTENPADLVDGGQGFADQYAQGQQDYPTQQDAAVYQGQGPGPIIGRDALNALVTKYGGLGDDAIKQLADINTQRSAARNDYNTQIAKLEAMQPQGPSESEKWFKLAAAYADPGKTGSFLEGTGHAATAMAEHSKANREYQQEFMKNRIMAGLKRGEFTMEDLARQEKSTVDMAQLGINSQEKLAALLEKVNSGERNRLAGITVHFNDANGEITTVDKGTNLVTTLRVADIPENVRVEILKDATKRAEGYPPEEKTAKIEQFMKDNLTAYAKTRTAVKLGDTAPLQLAPTSATTGSGVPSHTGSTITPSKGPSFQGAPVDIMKDLSRIPNEADKIAAGKQYEQQLNKEDVGYTSPFGQYVVAPPRARITTGEQTPQQKIEFEGQAAANLDEVKLFNTRVNEASSAGTEGVAAANQLLAVLPKIPNTGTLAPYRQQLGSVFGSLGIPGDITDSASMLGIAQAAVSGSVLGKQLLQKGVQTEGDAKRMEAAGPTLTQPKVALEFLTRTAKASGLRQLEMSAFRDDWRRKNQSDLGMGDAWNRYLNDTPMTALMPNNKLMFVNEYVDQYMKAHPTGSPEQRRGAALNDWRKLGGM